MPRALSVSIMSLRGYPADDQGPSSFYVRASIDGHDRIQTDPKCPRKPGDNVQFMEHIVLPYRQNNKEALTFELLQQSQGGDLVLGECKMRVADVVAAGAVHSWFPFMDASDPELKAGELLMAIQTKGRGAAPSKYRAAADPLSGKGKVDQSVKTSSPFVSGPSRQGRRWRWVPKVVLLAVVVAAGVVATTRPAKTQRYVLEDGDRVCVIGECRKRAYHGVTGLEQLIDQDANAIEPGQAVTVQA